MAICPFAVWRPIPANATQPKMSPRVAIWHTAVDGKNPDGSLYGDFTSRSDGIEAHFFVRDDGVIEQYVDTGRTADANLRANPFAISHETEDDGRPEENPWSPAQLASIIRLARWEHEVHGIPLTLAQSWDGSGQGWHAMWGAPSPWTPSVGKTCPGSLRIAQLRDVVLPALAAGPSSTSVASAAEPPVIPPKESRMKLVKSPGRGHALIGGPVPFRKIKNSEELSQAARIADEIIDGNDRQFDVTRALMTQGEGLPSDQIDVGDLAAQLAPHLPGVTPEQVEQAVRDGFTGLTLKAQA